MNATATTEINLHEVIRALEYLSTAYPAERLSAYMMERIDKANDTLIQRMCKHQKEEEKKSGQVREWSTAGEGDPICFYTSTRDPGKGV